MKKLWLFLILLLLIPVVTAELSDSDLKKIESVVRREVQSSNDEMRDDLKADIDNIKAEIDKVLEDISGASSVTKTILVLAVAGIVIVAETCISFLKFLVWKSKRKLESRKEKKLLKKPIPRPPRPPKPKIDKHKLKLERLKAKIKKKEEIRKAKEQLKLLKKSL